LIIFYNYYVVAAAKLSGRAMWARIWQVPTAWFDLYAVAHCWVLGNDTLCIFHLGAKQSYTLWRPSHTKDMQT